MNTKHYIPWNYGINTFFQGKDVFFPTEFLHGLYDGGHGAGLDDYWNLMLSNPLSAGGFLWDFCDQAAVRTDQNGRLDTKGNAAADGILGPYREKEGSFYTIKEIWSPVYFYKKVITKEFDGIFQFENRYDFTNLHLCTFRWQLKKFSGLGAGDTTAVTGSLPSPNIEPKTSGNLSVSLPKNWKDFDVLYITVTDLYGRHLNTWSWSITTPYEMATRMQPKGGTGTVSVREETGSLTMKAGDVEVTIDKKTGLLTSAKNSKVTLSLKNGPVLLMAGSVISTGNNPGTSSSGPSSGSGTSTSTATTARTVSIAPPTITHSDAGGSHVVKVAYGQDNQRYQFTWTMMPAGILHLRYQYQPINSGGGVRSNHEMLGVTFDYPEENVKGIQLIANGPYHVYKNRMKGTTFNSWNKPYNNAVTGELWQYPEFKGYYSNFYAGKLQTKESDFLVYTDTENLFLHLFNPAVPRGLGNSNSMAVYPKSGGISFMHGITSIGTKSQRREDLGPQSHDNIVFANGGNDTMVGTLYFDFR